MPSCNLINTEIKHMVIAIVGISLLFTAIGFVVTEKNAKYLLAGYNTMSKKIEPKST